MRLFIQRSDYAGGLDLYLETGHEPAAVALPVVFKTVDLGQITQPTIQIHRRDSAEFLQNLMDQLWMMGIRPAGRKAADEQVKAIQYHLEDMRRLVFKARGQK
jgi:hypothetical protein